MAAVHRHTRRASFGLLRKRWWHTITRVPLALTLSGVVGCATVPHGAGFDDVQREITARGGPRLEWRRGGDTAVVPGRAAVDTLLTHELTPDAAVAVALLNNPEVQLTYARLGIGRAALIDAGTLSNPLLDVSTLYGGGASVLELSVAHGIFGIFQLPQRRRVASADFEATKLDVAHAVFQFAAETRQAYYSAVAAEQALEIQRNVTEAASLSADIARRQHDAGNITDADLDNARADHAKAAVELMQAVQAAADAREALAHWLGVPGDTTWRIPAHLSDLPATELASDQLETQAIAHRLDLAAARAEITAAGAALGLTGVAGLVPDVMVGVRTERDREGREHVTGPTLELPIPLFDRGQASRARAIATLQARRARYLVLALDARSQVRRARLAMQSARARAVYVRDTILPLRHRLTEATQLQYNGMLVGIYQLLNVKRDEIAAGHDYVQALRDYWIARAALDAAVGGRVVPERASTTFRETAS